MTQVAKALKRLEPWLPLRENASFSGAFDAVYSGAHADVVTLWQDALAREEFWQKQKQELDGEWGAQPESSPANYWRKRAQEAESAERRFFDPLQEKVRELESEKAQLEAVLAREERKSELLVGKVEEWKASADHWQERAKQAEKRHTWPKVTPTGHTYVEPRTYEALRHEHDNAAQAEVECWAAGECPPEPTWEMVGSAHREVERLQRECDEWKARAEAVERERDKLDDRLVQVDMELSWAVAIPPVARADIEKVVDRWWARPGFQEDLENDLWALLSGDDPAVHVVRESDLPEVGRTDDGWTDGTRHGWEGTSETAMECVETHLEWARFYAAAARAIEAEAAVDLVEDAAVAAFKAEWHRADEEGDEGNRVRRGIRAARHVLGQEAGDE